jgi:hypothetical protein
MPRFGVRTLQGHHALDDEHIRAVDPCEVGQHVVALVGVQGHLQEGPAVAGRSHQRLEATEVVGLRTALAVQEALGLQGGVGEQEAIGGHDLDPGTEASESGAELAGDGRLADGDRPGEGEDHGRSRPDLHPVDDGAEGIGGVGVGHRADASEPGMDARVVTRATLCVHQLTRGRTRMGLFDRFKKTAEDVKDSATDLAEDHGDEAKDAIDKAADFASDKTDLDDKIDQGADAAKDAIDKLAGDDTPK